MDNAGKHFKSFVEWGKIRQTIGARTLTVNGITEPVVPPMTRTSYPIPVRRQGQLQIAFMVCPFVLRPGPVHMWPPNKVAWFDPVSGNLITLSNVSPADFGQKDSPDKELPKWQIHLSTSVVDNTFEVLEKHLYELYDTLFMAWVVGVSISGQAKLQSQAREFFKIFNQISEPPLHPYYEALGRDWFGWLRAVAQ